MEGLPRGQPGSGASEVTWQKKIQGRVTFCDALPLKTPEAQASDNSLLVFIQQWEGRSTEWPSFFVQMVGREKKSMRRVTLLDVPPLKTPEAQASDNSLLVFIQQWEGRSTEWPSFFVHGCRISGGPVCLR